MKSSILTFLILWILCYSVDGRKPMLPKFSFKKPSQKNTGKTFSLFTGEKLPKQTNSHPSVKKLKFPKTVQFQDFSTGKDSAVTEKPIEETRVFLNKKFQLNKNSDSVQRQQLPKTIQLQDVSTVSTVSENPIETRRKVENILEQSNRKPKSSTIQKLWFPKSFQFHDFFNVNHIEHTSTAIPGETLRHIGENIHKQANRNSNLASVKSPKFPKTIQFQDVSTAQENKDIVTENPIETRPFRALDKKRLSSISLLDLSLKNVQTRQPVSQHNSETVTSPSTHIPFTKLKKSVVKDIQIKNAFSKLDQKFPRRRQERIHEKNFNELWRNELKFGPMSFMGETNDIRIYTASETSTPAMTSMGQTNDIVHIDTNLETSTPAMTSMGETNDIVHINTNLETSTPAMTRVTNNDSQTPYTGVTVTMRSVGSPKPIQHIPYCAWIKPFNCPDISKVQLSCIESPIIPSLDGECKLCPFNWCFEPNDMAGSGGKLHDTSPKDVVLNAGNRWKPPQFALATNRPSSQYEQKNTNSNTLQRSTTAIPFWNFETFRP